MSTVTYDYLMYFPIILISIKLVFLFLCSLHFFPPWNMWVLGLWVWFGGGQVKLYFFLFFTKHKVVYVNYSLILTIFFVLQLHQASTTRMNYLQRPVMKQSTVQWAWKITILTFIMSPKKLHVILFIIFPLCSLNCHFNFYYEPKN